jgi:hypothetical protein
MKNILTIFFCIIFINFAYGQGDAPPILKGMTQTEKSVGATIRTPNNQVTKLSSSSALLETGNANILFNPSFEHATYDLYWSIISGATLKVTTDIDNTKVFSGLAALSVGLLSQQINIYQDSPVANQSYKDGVQGLASIRVKSSAPGVKICSRVNFTTSTTNCVNVVNNSKWGLYKVPFIMGEFANGIAITSNGVATSGTVYIDDAFVGAVDLTQNMNACNDASCETEFSAYVSGSTVSRENYDWIASCSNPSTGIFDCTLNPIFTQRVNCTATALGSSGSPVVAYIAQSSTTSLSVYIRNTSNALQNADFMVQCARQGSDFTAAKQLSNGNTYSSTNADTDWASCGHTTSSFTGFGTVTNIKTICKREGSDLLIKGNFDSGTPTAVEARLSLPVWNGSQLISKNSSVISTVQLSGMVGTTEGSTTYFSTSTLMEPSVSYITFGRQSSTNATLIKRLGTEIGLSGRTFSIDARIPIEGWQQSNFIIGQFSGLESCSDSYECESTFSAYMNPSGIIITESLDFINGNCTRSGTNNSNFSCTFKTGIFTVQPVCTAQTDGTPTNGVQIGSTSTTFSGTTFASAAFAATGVYFSCQKQGVDYIGKTAKAVASDQNTRTSGAVNTELFSFSFGTTNATTACSASPCSYLHQIGSLVSSVTRTGSGDYTVNFSKNMNKLKCSGNSVGVTAVTIDPIRCEGCTSTRIVTRNSTNGTGTDSYPTILCHLEN